MSLSKIPKFYKLSVAERLREVHERGLLSKEDYLSLLKGDHLLEPAAADKMIENVIGVMGIPIGIAVNFLINDKEYLIPLAVEEPSIVAALSSAAKTVHAAGGFQAESSESLLIGQVQLIDVPNHAKARAAIIQNEMEVLNLANSLHPNLVARGGGARELEVRTIPSSGDAGDMLVIHIIVDTCDAMGANLVNTMCEGIAPLLEKITNGKSFLRILSNLTDRALVRAWTRIPVDLLAGKGMNGDLDGEQVRDGIIIASDFALADPYRAVTHNKGVMNGIDAVALATGNDWRAIEAAAHAWASRGGQYTALTRWSKGEDGSLMGFIEIPLKVGIVGGPLQSNKTVGVNHRIMKIKSAQELARIMAAVGLAQNFSALRALATDGIQKGHMTLHARSVVMAAGAGTGIFDTVVDRLIEDGQIKIWRAREIIEEVNKDKRPLRAVSTEEASSKEDSEHYSAGHGKIILLGEHAVVYGRHAIAAPVPMAARATIHPSARGEVEFIVPRWGIEYTLNRDPLKRTSFERPLGTMLEKFGLLDQAIRIEVFPTVPRAMGLGGSAAVAVAMVRALDKHFNLHMADAEINSFAFEFEKVAHSKPSGIDNTVATYGKLMMYTPAKTLSKTSDKTSANSLAEPATIDTLTPGCPIPLVIGISGIESLTAGMVTQVRKGWQQNPDLYNRVFNEIDQLTLSAREAIINADMKSLGNLMNFCQGQLNALQTSSWELEEMIQISRRHGALGAKLTGAGGGGSIIALCPDNRHQVVHALQESGYQAMEVDIG
ncbi:MAG: hydroxymethylglutaryl-CoA reductase, degradative [Xanthomonadales bacterium]|nr:hydroxymethylglutaryl-CoA reductase, degradative [Xanthomonadales bacterium]